MITLDAYLTSSGKYPERLKSAELTEEVKSNATELLKRVNALLADLKIGSEAVSSGFRPTGVNSKILKAAVKSAHCVGMAIDLVDDKAQSLCKMITVELLKKHQLSMESPKYTVGVNTNWTHLQSRPTKSVIFVP